MNPFSQLLSGTFSLHIKKYLFDILKERFNRNEEFIDRLSTNLITQKDMEGLGKLVSDLYEVGYLKALQDQQKQLEQKGFKAIIKPEKTQESIEKNSIFPCSVGECRLNTGNNSH